MSPSHSPGATYCWVFAGHFGSLFSDKNVPLSRAHPHSRSKCFPSFFTLERIRTNSHLSPSLWQRIHGGLRIGVQNRRRNNLGEIGEKQRGQVRARNDGRSPDQSFGMSAQAHEPQQFFYYISAFCSSFPDDGLVCRRRLLTRSCSLEVNSTIGCARGLPVDATVSHSTPRPS